MIIYCVENTVNGKRYIGKTTYSLQKRWSHHRNDAKRGHHLLSYAIRKYGEEAFTIREVARASTTAELDELEKTAIKELETHVSTGKGYNVTWGGSAEGGRQELPARSPITAWYRQNV